MTQSKDEMLLAYWSIRGLAEPIRLALHYTKTPFTDKMYTTGYDWFGEKFSLGFDFPNLPYLVDGDVKLTQSKAILYYLGRKLGLMGKNPHEEALVMMLCEQGSDLRTAFSKLCYGRDGESESEKKKFVETTLTDNLKQFDAYFGKNKSKFAVGDKATVADFQLFDFIDCCCLLDGGRALLDKYTNVKKFLQTIRELPELKEYIIKSQAQLPINGAVAKFGGSVIKQN